MKFIWDNQMMKVILLKWDGEWQITFEVFQDLGAAF